MTNSLLRVLIVEDSTADAKLVSQELQRMGHPLEFERVETAGELREALDRTTWDAVIADWTMPFDLTEPSSLASSLPTH
jgi:CheY-like chemotaxis protein